MSGFELILAAALCLSCAQNDSLPVDLIQFNNDGNVVTQSPHDLSVTESPPLGDTEADRKETLKEQQMRILRNNVNGRHLRIATLEDFPLSYTEVLENGTRIGKGVAFELIDFLSEKFNFTYEVRIPERNIIGSKGDFDKSLIQMINDSSADLAAAFIPLLSEQRGFIYYSTTTLDEGEWIMVMQRPRESATGSGLTAPFDFWVWILILISLVVVGPLIYALIILRNKLTGDDGQASYSISHCAWFVYGALMKQGSTLSPIADSTRMLFATWWIFITILTSFYTANLTAFLTLSKFTLPYNTVNDIYSKNKQFVSSRGGAVEYAIRNQNESLSLLNKMVQNKHAQFSDVTNDTFNLHNYVEKSGNVFVRDRPAINHMLYLDYRYRKTLSTDNEKIHCPFAMAKEPFLKKNRSFAYPINSNLSILFDPELLNLVESGIVKHLSGKGLPNAEICPQDLGSTERQLRNGDLMMTYYIMFAGYATGFAVLTTEILFRYINSRRDASKWARHGIGRTANGGLQFPSNSSRWLHNNSDNEKHRQVSPSSNVTPPPPYRSIFSGSNHNNNNFYNRNIQNWGRNDNSGGASTGLSSVVGAQERSGVRRVINGRDYMVFRNPNGQNQLVPMRAPSAALFQYTYTE